VQPGCEKIPLILPLDEGRVYPRRWLASGVVARRFTLGLADLESRLTGQRFVGRSAKPVLEQQLAVYDAPASFREAQKVPR
jgi:hypothetical protein